MPTKDRLTRSQIADLLDVPPLFVSDEGEANGMEPAFSDADVLRFAIVRELLGALEPWEACDVFDHLRKWVPTSPWGWLVIYDGDPIQIVHTVEQDAADLAVRCKGFRCRLHLDPFLGEVLERLDAFRGE